MSPKKIVIVNRKGIHAAIDDPLAGLGRIQKFFVKVLGLDAVLTGIPGRTTDATTRTALFGNAITDTERAFAINRTPTGHFLVIRVAEDIFDKWFKIVNTKDKNDTELDTYVQGILRDLEAKDVFTRMAIYERAYGWAIILIGYDDNAEKLDQPVVDAQGISGLDTYSNPQINSVVEEDNSESERFGLPRIYRLFSRSRTRKQEIHYSRAVHVATRRIGHRWKGMSVIDPAYDDMLSLRYVSWGVAMTMIRYGPGFPDVTLPGAKKSAIDAFIDSNQFDNLNALRYFVHNERQQLKFLGVEGKALNPMPYYEIPLERISMASGIPKNILRGAQAGTLTGSQVNEREYFKFISDQQSRYEHSIRAVIAAILATSEKEEYKTAEFDIEWNPGFSLNAVDSAMVEFTLERANQIRTNYMQINEIRASQGLEEVEGGDVILGIQKATLGPGLMADIEADQENIPHMETNLKEALEAIIDKVVHGDIDPEQAELEAQMVIDEVVNKIRQMTRLRVQEKAGRPITALAPEIEAQFIAMKRRYLAAFRKILEDKTQGWTD